MTLVPCRTIETKRVSPEWSCSSFWSDPITSVISALTALTLTLSVNEPLLIWFLYRRQGFVDPQDGYTGSFTWTLPNNAAGYWYIFIRTDIHRQVNLDDSVDFINPDEKQNPPGCYMWWQNISIGFVDTRMTGIRPITSVDLTRRWRFG